MSIVLKTRGTITNYELYAKLGFHRSRQDIASLLKRINQDESFNDIFDNAIVADSVKALLKSYGLITDSGKVSTTGKAFIEYPYLDEEEEGVFSVELLNLSLGNSKHSMVIKMTRKLGNESGEEHEVTFREVDKYNSFLLEDEECKFVSIFNKSKRAYVGNKRTVDVEIDITNKKYSVESIKGTLGTVEADAILNAKQIVENEMLDFTYDENELKLFVKSAKALTDEEIVNGFLNRELASLSLKREPFIINEPRVAIDYAYLYAYCLLDEGRFLSTDELDDIFANELLSGSNIEDSIKTRLLSFKYSLEEFKEKLPGDKYEKLDYRIRITKELLNVEAIKSSDKRFATLSNYNEIVDYLNKVVPASNVDKVYLVMGYAFVDNKKTPNRIIDCLKALQAVYNEVIIVDKAPTKNNVDSLIYEKVSNLGVRIKHKPAISEHFHDRYIIFEMNDGKYEVFMCSSDIGQLFGADNHIRGSIVKQQIQDVTMEGRNLIEIATGR